eukprot:2227549-Rhodomonas_salina.1
MCPPTSCTGLSAASFSRPASTSQRTTQSRICTRSAGRRATSLPFLARISMALWTARRSLDWRQSWHQCRARHCHSRSGQTVAGHSIQLLNATSGTTAAAVRSPGQ